MGPELKQTQRLQMELRLTLQMQQTLKMLQVSKLELIQMIREELERNPILEERENLSSSPLEGDLGGDVGTDHIEDSIYNNLQREFSEAPYIQPDIREYEDFERVDRQKEKDYEDYIYARTEGTSLIGRTEEIGEDRNIRFSTQSIQKSLADHLLEQLAFADLSDKDREIGEHIIMNLNDDGYLKGESEDENLVRLIAIQARASEEDVLRVLKIIQQFDPPGIAARDLKECLLIQARHYNMDNEIVTKAIIDHLPDFEKKRYYTIAKALNISERTVRDIEKVISSFNPRPGAYVSSIQADYIRPDVEVYRSEGEFKIRLIKDDIPRIYINKDYLSMMRRRGRDPNSKFIRDNYKLAKIFITAINERENRLLQVTKVIVNKQRDFFLRGEGFLRPLQEKDIAAELNLNVSTISRIFNSKYILTPHGVFSMKYFIKRPVVSNNGEDISSDVIKTMIRNMIEEEDPRYPLKDDEIVRRLERQNIRIKRRTIAKYREEMGIRSYIVRKRMNNLLR